MTRLPLMLVTAGGAWLVCFVLVGAPDAAAPVAAAWGGVAVVAAVLAAGRRSVAGKRAASSAAASFFVALALSAAAGSLVASIVAVQAPMRSPAVLTEAARAGTALDVDIEVIGRAEPAGGASFGSSAERMRFAGVLVSASAAAGRTLRAPALVFADGRTAPRIGERLRMRAALQPAAAGEASAYLVFGDSRPVLVSAPPWYLAWADPLREGLHGAALGLPGDGGDLLPGLAIGDTGAVTAALDTAMKRSSLSHLTAVSGANCAVVVAAIMVLGAAIGLPRLVRTACALAALAGFTVLVTPEPSVLRAAVMATVLLLALASGRLGEGVAALGLAVLVILLSDPWLSRSYGLALSALATAGLLLLSRPLTKSLARWLPHPLAAAVAIPLAAQLACQPVLVLLDPTLPLSGVLANLLAEPAAPLATVLGLLACLLLPVVPPLGVLCLRLAWVPSAWIAQIARTVDALPVGRLPWIGGLVGLLATSLIVAAALSMMLSRRGARRRPVAGAAVILLLGAGAWGGAVAASGLWRALTVPQDWMIAACDIGQGDAIVLHDGEHFGLIDTGPDPRPLARCLDELGIRHLDLLVLTHYDLDHVGGVDAVIGMVGTALVGLPENAADARVPAKLLTGGAVVRRGAAGESGSLGALDWRVLWPGKQKKAMSTGNAGSITLLVRGHGLGALFLGDLGEEAQDALLRSTPVPPVDVVKVAHHGSADQSAELYRRLHARVGLISVGMGNSYGHPTARLLGILRSVGTSAERTDRQGRVLVAPGSHGGLRIWSERPPPGDVGVGG
ncbi:ComEC/Rec2 family competence protein [Rathayibacter sp. YIM 133350]|uniref:ComEC/Rec2 family competence protein n=1 Tax=Rathayibacter sp. YIM 133350 TaxID=3131992 RepID=UPI00307DC00F